MFEFGLKWKFEFVFEMVQGWFDDWVLVVVD